MNKQDLQFLKKISLEVLEEEWKKEKVEGNFYPITITEYYKKILSSKKLTKLEKIFSLITPLSCPAFYTEKNQEIIVFISYFSQYKIKENQLFNLIFACFHEFRHLYQNQKWKKNSLTGYLHIIEQKIRLIDTENDYLFNHDLYSFEIGANLYGISKAKKYIQKNYPNKYQKIKLSIEEQEKKYIINYFTYDAIDTINRYILLERKNNKAKIKNKNSLDSISKIFLNDDYSCKKIKDIIENKAFSSLEKELVYSFITTEEFLKSISLDDLTTEETTLLTNALIYALVLYQNQKITLQKYQLEKEVHQNFLTTKITKLYQELNNIIIGNEKTFRNEKNKKTHQENIHTYLNLIKIKKEK